MWQPQWCYQRNVDILIIKSDMRVEHRGVFLLQWKIIPKNPAMENHTPKLYLKLYLESCKNLQKIGFSERFFACFEVQFEVQ
jgi:hypothetical protein